MRVIMRRVHAHHSGHDAEESVVTTCTMTSLTHDDLSHALRTPLTSVLGLAFTLAERWNELDDETRMSYIKIVYGEALRMAHSIEQVDRTLAQIIDDHVATGSMCSSDVKRAA